MARYLRRRKLRALAARVASFVATMVLLVGVVRSGARYFYCPMMNVAMEDSCCASAAHRAGDAPAIETPDCCQAKRLGTLPSSAGVASLELHAAPLAAMLPPFDVAALARRRHADFALGHDARAGPSSPARERSLFMIYNC